jgi:aryl-phospho-beta-D-glucosidase BglC (GH1 family)
LKGVNLGFWLEPEGYPFGIHNIHAARNYFDLIADMIGPDDARKFWQQYQQNFITRKDIEYIKQLGFNSVRVPFDYRLLVNEYFLGSYEPKGFDYLDNVVKWCRDNHLYAILDMHCAPGTQAGWNSDDGYTWPWLFEDSGAESRKLTIKLWVAIARRYAAEPAVAGYDLLGEPIPQYCDPERLNKRLEPFYKQLTTEIRKVDSKHLIILGGALWDRNFDVFGKPFDARLVYTTHLYSRTNTYTDINYFINFSKTNNVPVWLGEFGERDPELIKSLRLSFEKDGAGWCLWTFKKMNNNHCLVQMKRPDDFGLVQNYANGVYTNWEEKVKARPENEKTKKALLTFLENCRLENCVPSDFYKQALNLDER